VKLLLHVCCGVCIGGPLDALQARGAEVVGYFFNPNIQPEEEFRKRLEALRKFQAARGLEIVYDEGYDADRYVESVLPNDENRCLRCYRLRLRRTAQTAKKIGCDAFSTTLLVSRHQKHDLVRQAGDEAAAEFGIPFHYEDWRPLGRCSTEAARSAGLYRQKYCGCSFGLAEQLSRQSKRRTRQE
jgi:predicted adenine nucleotide alpha hydrolase (AANH) superfamily ATPase